MVTTTSSNARFFHLEIKLRTLHSQRWQLLSQLPWSRPCWPPASGGSAWRETLSPSKTAKMCKTNFVASFKKHPWASRGYKGTWWSFRVHSHTFDKATKIILLHKGLDQRRSTLTITETDQQLCPLLHLLSQSFVTTLPINAMGLTISRVNFRASLKREWRPFISVSMLDDVQCEGRWVLTNPISPTQLVGLLTWLDF